MQTFVINLDSRTDKWQWMQKQLEAFAGLRVERFSAIVGKNVDLSKVQLGYRAQRAIFGKEKSAHYDLDSVGNLGCYMSHQKLWKHIASLESEEPVLILEDDCQFSKDPTETLHLLKSTGHEAAWLGTNSWFAPELEGSITLRGQTFSFLKPWTRGGNDAYGSHAYMITPRVAKLLLEGSNPMDLSPDFYIHARLADLHIREVFVQLAKQAPFWAGPDIEHPPMPIERDAKRKGMLMGAIVATCVMLLGLYLLRKFKLHQV